MTVLLLERGAAARASSRSRSTARSIVVWRGASGALGARRAGVRISTGTSPRARWSDDELVCTGHGWSFDCAGHAFKRTELGRVDPKDDIETVRIVEADGTIALSR